jgi:D-alanyl-D-alanine endopeptidase (penicillin-binding protein 7)
MVQLAVAILMAAGLAFAPATAAEAATRTSAKKTPARATSARTTKARAVKPSATVKRVQAAPTTTKKAYSASAARARRARLARARATARSRELRDAQTPRFLVDASGNEVPDVRAAAAIIYNPQTNEVLWESNSQDQRSIASITKIMTALVVFESGLDLAQPVVVERPDVLRASTTYLRAGYTLTPDDLLHLLLIGSDNAAARVLARVSPYGSDGFVERMNAKATELGLQSTHYADPSGLLAENVSSAYDMARLIAYVSADERVGGIMRQASATVHAGPRTINVNSTNQIVKTGDIEVLGGKTGFISRSGYCLATLLRLPQSGQQVAVVVLGAKSNAGRFWETRHLFNWFSGKATSLLGVAKTEQQLPQENN